MKTTIKTIVLAAASLFAAMSCQKEESGMQNLVKEGETIQVNINAGLGDFVAADATKATATPVVRLEWVNGDKVDAYYGINKISGTDGISVTASDNKIFAKLTGTITSREGMDDASIITFVYSNGCTVEDNLTFNFSSQGTTIPFVAYATVKYGEIKSGLSDKMVEFKLATSVMKIAATNLAGGGISNATISGINTKVTLTPQISNETVAITGSEPNTITKTDGIDASSDETRAIFTVGLVPDSNKGRNITVTQTKYTNKGVITSTEIKASKSYTTPASLFTCGTLGTGGNAHDYVLIAGTKWATQNLAITASGKTAWKGGNTSSTVKVPGTTSDVIVGDYFQWAASYKGYNVQSNQKPDSLLIYTSFTKKSCGGAVDACIFRLAGEDKTYQFSTSNSEDGTKIGISPYYESSAYTKYTASDGIVTLTPSDDVASILWSGTWRMPTSSEIEALTKATYWKWDGTDKGCYVYAPQTGDAGKKNNETTNTYNKAHALLFFPAGSHGNLTSLTSDDTYGDYWSSTHHATNVQYAYCLFINSEHVYAPTEYYRHSGFLVRPVSD